MSPNGNPRDLTTVAQDYLKVIYKLTLSDRRCTPALVAERLAGLGHLGAHPEAGAVFYQAMTDLTEPSPLSNSTSPSGCWIR